MSALLCQPRSRFIRFEVEEAHEDSLQPTGIFQVLPKLEDSGTLARREARELHDMQLWFARHLPVPSRWSRSRRANAAPRAICWFRREALASFPHLDRLICVIAKHGFPVRRVLTNRPGYVVYEDDFQIAAEPFRDTREEFEEVTWIGGVDAP